MKLVNKYYLVSIAVLLMVAIDCKSDENIFESTTAVSFSTVYYGTSSNKFYSAENEFKAVQFAQVNWLKLMADIAKGQGEYLTTMADLLKVSSAKKPAFYKVSQFKFNRLFPSADTTPEQLVNNLKREIGKLNEV
jgi:hypothetical protein